MGWGMRTLASRRATQPLFGGVGAPPSAARVSHPIAGIIPILDAAETGVLAGATRRSSGREVHRLAGTAPIGGLDGSML